MQKSKLNEREISLKTVLKGVLMLVVLLIMGIGFLIYVLNFRYNSIIKATLNFIPYPAVIVDYKDIITVNALDDNLRSVKNFYEAQDFEKVGLRIDYSTTEGKKRLKIKEKVVLNRMIEDKVIERIASEKGIKVTKELVNQELIRKMDEYGTNVERFLNKIYTLYQWDLEEFQENVVKPSIVRKELAKWHENDTADDLEQANIDINEAKKKIDAGAYFTDVINEFSDKPAEKVEDLNWLHLSLIMPELAENLANMKEREVSQIIESKTGYHILKLEERKKDEVGDAVKFHQVFIRKPSFSIWLSDQIKQAHVLIPLSEYEWDESLPGVIFNDLDLIEFEKKSFESIVTDPNKILDL